MEQADVPFCHVCGKACSSMSAIQCGQCQHATYCSVDCQKSDWQLGKHALECWNSHTQSYDELSREMMMDLYSRTHQAQFPTQLGLPIDAHQVDVAHHILHHLEQQRDPKALETANSWLKSVRVNHVGALQSQPQHVQDEDLLDFLDSVSQYDQRPNRIKDIEIHFDVHGTLNPKQRQELSEYVAQNAFDQRARVQVIGENYFQKRREQFMKWRGSRKEKLKALREERSKLEQQLAWVNKQIRKKSWNPLSRWRAKRREKGAKKRWSPTGP